MLTSLTSPGNAGEVAEIILELDADDAKYLLRLAVGKKLSFAAENLCEFADIDLALAKAALMNSVSELTPKDMEELEDAFDEEFLLSVRKAYPTTVDFSWKAFYDGYDDRTDSENLWRLQNLASLGNTDEISEVILELNRGNAKLLLQKAVDAKMVFDVFDLSDFLAIDRTLAETALRNAADRLTTDDVETLSDAFDENLLRDLCKENHIPLPECLLQMPSVSASSHPQKHGFLSTLLMLFSADTNPTDRQNRTHDHSASAPHTHNGRCNGDCAHCPPHYGYRYGRWYYGHDHAYGCEFGGNKCSGSRD